MADDTDPDRNNPDRNGSTNTALVAIIVLVIIIIIALLYYFSGWGDRRETFVKPDSQIENNIENNQTLPNTDSSSPRTLPRDSENDKVSPNP